MGEPSFGSLKWSEVFHDPQLEQLIRTALAQNFDLRIAASRVEQARAQVTVTRSNQFPNLTGSIQETGVRFPPLTGGSPSYTYAATLIGPEVSWDIDFWGKYRRATEAARAQLLAADWARRAVMSSVVTNVATAYLQLRQLDLQLDIARRTLASRLESLKLTETLVDGGASPLSDQRQAEQLVETAAGAMPLIEQQIQQTENALHILMGEDPGPLARGQALTDQAMPPALPAGLPSQLLERRPDIEEAEQNLVAANAEIGVARAAYFPDISLTAQGGFESAALTTLFRGVQGAFTFTGSATQPLFTAGRLGANLKIAEAQRDQALLAYRQTIQGSFRDVSNALIAFQKSHDYREHEERLTEAARDATRLSRMRYEGGATSYLEVLTNDTNFFNAELSLTTARLNERLAVVQAYWALGGGWE